MPLADEPDVGVRGARGVEVNGNAAKEEIRASEEPRKPLLEVPAPGEEQKEVTAAEPVAGEQEVVEKTLHGVEAGEAQDLSGPPQDATTEQEVSQDWERERPEAQEQRGVLFDGITQAKLPCTFEDEDAVYLHAVTMLRPMETPEAEPFLLEEKGFGGKDFAFAVDRGGLRFYLSKVNLSEMNLSKSGMLLLGKQESLQIQGSHENVVNELRAHGTLLPFKLGTVARSKDELYERVDQHLDDMKAALLELSLTKWWALTLSVLDARMSQLVGTTTPTAERDLGPKRKSPPPTSYSRSYDIKLLERMLQKEKKIAETVHKQLDEIAERSDVDMIVGFGSSSSENWKPILKSSYEVKPSQLPTFYRKITELQYQYLLFELMFSLAGAREAYSFSPGDGS
jgi:hypothetical protein